MYEIAVTIQRDFYKLPINTLQPFTSQFVGEQLTLFQSGQWYTILDMVEFLYEHFRRGSLEQQGFEREINDVLEREKSGYRFIAGALTSITTEVEMKELERAVRRRGRFVAVAEHLKTALDLYSKKPDADYRNSVKESISAVEAAVRIISGNSNATLGDALKLIDDAKPMHAAFKQALLKLYGYTSDEGGIRHSLLDAPNVDEADSRFMLVACSAFANYLISRS